MACKRDLTVHRVRQKQGCVSLPKAWFYISYTWLSSTTRLTWLEQNPAYIYIPQSVLHANILVSHNPAHTIFSFRVTILRDKETRKSRGVAFLLYLAREEAQACVQATNNCTMFGRTLKASIAKDNGRAPEFIRRREYPDKSRCTIFLFAMNMIDNVAAGKIIYMKNWHALSYLSNTFKISVGVMNVESQATWAIAAQLTCWVTESPPRKSLRKERKKLRSIQRNLPHHMTLMTMLMRKMTILMMNH